ncbi:MAG TPA: polyprenyl synthetase family protein [Bacteroidales bacterium]|nr:polyprenyl synthetase family protein [Bacteroidales bacterium]HOK74116.1 polyprenyl synthetase family protein [Bacteroidales bacterium]HOM40496.1 polyprenyl synthetase family protein [Bacteroidales bacterium]HOU29772.1 polyprenyl synthetase family protein [Bacteroidales bacterium]HPP92554.1 polyprenyl synthetase family protein [Bacteroidales bacterium]
MEKTVEKILPLVVPVEKQVRDEIRIKATLFTSEQNLLPPVTIDKLEVIASEVLNKYGWDERYKAFVMVCCGNALWRPVVASIPYNRRLLLLPQCLKNSKKCVAGEDEFGLLCGGCGNCNIPEYLQEAENLGYLTIVAEGTTIASKLIESGKIEAIVGVACMESLQKIFKTINSYFVPAIGVPLVFNGCTDTIADEDWLREELHYYANDNQFSLLNLHSLKKGTISIFNTEQINKLLKLSDSTNDEIVKTLMLSGGKRMRPLLAILSYKAFKNNTDEKLLKNLAMSIECFHKASLVHDDIEDEDSLRYGKKTIHAQYGVPIAINTGDFLIGEGYRLISECDMDASDKVECLKIISEGHSAMAKGQGNELLARKNNILLPVNELLEIYKNKTGEAIRVALLTGAIAGGADERVLKILSRFSYLFGIAYQLNDDLEDLKEVSSTSSLKNPNILISILAESKDLNLREALHNAVSNNDFCLLRELIVNSNIKEETESLISMYINLIYECLAELNNITLKIALHDIVGKIFGKYL